ncbi:MAG: hypothetical protein L0H93_10630 [Nocardioides sp.]|nr:hypothetical protein [Nocardioides sp.]
MTPWTKTRRTGQALSHLLLGTALCAALAGCGGEDNAEPTSEATESSDAPTASAPTPTPTPEAEEPAALDLVTTSGRDLTAVTAKGESTGNESLDGKLIIAERGCMHLTSRTGPPTLLVFPAGATLDADRKPTMVVDGKRYPVGSRLSLTGETMQLTADEAKRASPCVARGDVFRIAAIS